ncbi:helix-turn-helix domain-containing protein [Allochromatium humboldtianum]|uniref:Helix-turn-helix domain-containing protein n=1 Tax=Allochromatium humboldtianum TaxID=504901 RepID=A0A850RGU9_9GAMM|nr:helix-turn-helix domain-containing protein [Allochromatium humboldtianum]NVZ10647.1 helix-turn-helix domain-containing protein [Allochromatium humboldtianum]
MPLSPDDHARIRGVTIEDAAKTLGIAKSTAYKLISRGELRTFKIGRARRVTPDAIEDCIKRLESRAA